MPITPVKLKEVLGEEGLNELLLLIEERSLEGRREILSLLDIIEHDLSELRIEFREFKREVNERFDRIQRDVNERFDRINERFDRMHEHMASMIKWTVGTLALFGTLITILLAIGQFLK